MPIPPTPPKPRPSLDDELREYLREQREADLKGKIEQLKEGQDRFYDLFLRHDAEDKQRHNEMRGDVRGLSLRVGEVERTVVKHGERLEHLDRRASRHDSELENTNRHIIGDLAGKATKAEERAAWLRRNALALIASAIAIAASVWHLFR